MLYVRTREPFDLSYHLEKFAAIAKNSKEYQGHGWGCAYPERGAWRIYRNLKPVWEDDLAQFGKSDLLLAHARSAFENRDIHVENNMPFYDGKYVFIFNGELRGVKIKESGRIGAEKIFNYIKRFDRGDMAAALKKGLDIIEKRTDYVRAMNIMLADQARVYVASRFNDDPEYFTLRYRENGETIICSEPYPAESGWHAIANRTITTF